VNLHAKQSMECVKAELVQRCQEAEAARASQEASEEELAEVEASLTSLQTEARQVHKVMRLQVQVQRLEKENEELQLEVLRTRDAAEERVREAGDATGQVRAAEKMVAWVRTAARGK